LQTQSECNAIKERKGKEIKQYKTKENKTKEEVKEELQKFIVHWNSIFLEDRKVTEKLEEKYLRIRKDYTKEEFIK
jgi:hemerythrin